MGKKRNESVEASSILDFCQFQQKGVAGVSCRNFGEGVGGQSMERAVDAKPERRQSKKDVLPIFLRCESDRPINSASLWEIPIILNALVSTVSR